jgi:hypothetical protein
VRTRSLALPDASDTRLLLAGVLAFLALVAYLAVAFAHTHALIFATDSSTAPNLASEVAPWTPSASKLAPVPRKEGGFDVRVTRTTRGPSYGALVQTLVPDPVPGRRYVVSLWLKGARPGEIAVELNEFRPGVARYPVETTVPATARWHHFTFKTRVKGVWLGLAIYVYRTDRGRRTWFAVRDLTAAVLGR